MLRTCTLLPGALLVAALWLACCGQGEAAASFEELVSMAHRLESSDNLSQQQVPEKQARQQQGLLYSFTREPKSAQCSAYFAQAKDKINQFHVKAQLFMEESRKGNKNWFGGMFGPLGALRSVAKFDPMLEELVDRYQANPKQLSEQVITCDLTKFLVRVLNNILFLYKTDLKTLVTGERALVNRAILDQLNRDQLVSRVNFYEFERPTGRQQRALLAYLGSVRDPSSVQLRDALNHYLSPGQFVLGRIMDTCMFALQFNEHWLKATAKAQCAGSVARGAGAHSRLSAGIDSAAKYEQVAGFCHEMLDVAADDQNAS